MSTTNTMASRYGLTDLENWFQRQEKKKVWKKSLTLSIQHPLKKSLKKIHRRPQTKATVARDTDYNLFGSYAHP